MSRKNAEILLGSVIFARSTSLLFAKIGLASISPLNLLAVRFCLAFLVLSVIFWKKLRQTTKADVLHGLIVGTAFFSVMVFETFGLRMTSASTTSFLENTAIVIVPLFEAILHRKAPDRKALLCAGVTLLGVGFLTLRGGLAGFGSGEALCMTAACCYATAIILTGKFSHTGDPILMGIFQIGFMGLYATVGSFLFETPRLPQSGTEWGVILGLALICSCFGFTLQPLAQRYTTAERAAQLCAINPLSVAVMSTVFLHETMDVWGVCGAALILTGIVLHNIHPRAVRVMQPATK